MAIQYVCENERRRQAVQLHESLNGIDYLEVLDLDAPLDSPRQRTLLVRFLKTLPDSLTAVNVRIEGGVRVTPVRALWAGRAAEADDWFAAGRISAAERDFFLAQPAPDQLLVVRTNSEGDASTYRFHLVTSSTGRPLIPAPPPGFDPLLTAVDFSFKVECPSDFDCRSEPECPVEATAPPAIDYLAKDYASFRKLLLDRLAVIMPDWRERNAADIGIALVELLAYAGDYLSYFQDAVATEAYLGTARRRTSVRRHARLLDYPMHDGCNARVWVAFQVNGGGDGLLLPQQDPSTGAPTRLLTRIPEARVIPPERIDAVRGAHRPEIAELMHDLRLYEAHNQINFYTWGDEECCLPKGATRATLQDALAARLRLRPGDVLIFEERHDPVTGVAEDADISHRHAVRLTHVHPAATEDGAGQRTPGPLVTDPLFDQPIVEIEWDAADALPFPLCLSTVIDGTLRTDISVALGNVALADHGFTIAGESLPPPRGPRRYRPHLQESGLTQQILFDEAQARTQPATATLVQEPRQALPAVWLTGDGERWIPRRDLLNSDRFAAEFVVEMENDGRAYLRFGDGLFGRAPTAVGFTARYRIGNGAAGNIGADSIAHVVVDGGGGITGVRNPLPAQGGVDRESNEQVKLYAPQAFRTQERAVTEQDYAAVVERHPAVQRAMATRRWTGSWYTMFITIDRKGGRPVDAAFEEEVRGWLERFRLTGHDVEIDAPRFVPLDIVLTVCVAPGYFKFNVKQALLQLFGTRDLPGGTLGAQRGFFHPDNFTFGQPVYLSQIIARAMDVPGVQWVDADDRNGKPNRFRRWGQPAHNEIERGLIELARLEIARLDNDPSRPENGRIDFLMEGGR
jgi:hypothetical protein